MYSKGKNTSHEVWGTGLFSSSGAGVATTKTFTVNEGVNKVVAYVSVVSAWGPSEPSITGGIILNQKVEKISSSFRGGYFSSHFYKVEAETNGQAGDIILNIAIGGSTAGNNADVVIIYE